MTDRASDYSEKEYEIALGRLIQIWAYAELILIGILAHLLGTDIRKCDLLWRTFQNMHGKLEFMELLTRHFVADGAQKTKLLEIIKSADVLNKSRNYYVHACWTVERDGSPLRILERRAPRKKGTPFISECEITPKEILDEIAKINGLLSRIADFRLNDLGRLQVASSPVPQTPPKGKGSKAHPRDRKSRRGTD